jgi:TonB family protein
MKPLPGWHFLTVLAAFALAPSLFAQRTAPKPTTFPSPKYPAVLVDTGTSGEATIDVVVKTDGSVGEPVLKSADHPAFGTEAMAVIEQWKFQPGALDGAPVDMHVTIPFKFFAPPEQKINAMAKRKVYLPLPGEPMTAKAYGRLKVKNPARPAYPATLAKSGVKEDVKLRFVVNPDGMVVNPQFETQPNVQLIIPAIAAVSQMTYEPPKKGGKGVYVESSTTLHFEEPPPGEGRGKGKGKGKGGGGER